MVSPMNSPVRLGVSPTATSTPTGVFNQRFEALFPRWNPGLGGLSRFPVVPPSLSACKCGTTQSTICHFSGSARLALPDTVLQPLTCRESSLPGCLSPLLLPVQMNVSSLTPWLLDFHTVQFSVSSGCFLFLNLLLSSFQLKSLLINNFYLLGQLQIYTPKMRRQIVHRVFYNPDCFPGFYTLHQYGISVIVNKSILTNHYYQNLQHQISLVFFT